MKRRTAAKVAKDAEKASKSLARASKVKIALTDESNVYSYKNPIIPNGWAYKEGDWSKGFVIIRESDNSEMVWVPVENLPQNGTLDGQIYDKKFGRRTFDVDDMVLERRLFDEPLRPALTAQIASVSKYGGFYISRYCISITRQKKLISRPKQMPWCGLKQAEAVAAAQAFEETDRVKSHLVFGAEYDTMLEWFIRTKVRPLSAINQDSMWGNYSNTFDKCGTPLGSIAVTGSNERWCTNNVYDVAGNLCEWTQEDFCGLSPVVRGGSYKFKAEEKPVCTRTAMSPDERYDDVGFRVAFCIY